MNYNNLLPQEIERLARTIPPGGWAVEPERPMATLLGSCVAVCLFDPELGMGGMNHFMLPQMKPGRHGDVDSLLAGDFAMETLLNALLERGAKKSRIQAKAFGGGTIIETSGESMRIGPRNATFTKEWMEREGIPLVGSDLLGPWSRKVLFLPATGDVYCRRMLTSMATAALIRKEEQAYAESLIRKPNPVEKKIEIF